MLLSQVVSPPSLSRLTSQQPQAQWFTSLFFEVTSALELIL